MKGHNICQNVKTTYCTIIQNTFILKVYLKLDSVNYKYKYINKYNLSLIVSQKQWLFSYSKCRLRDA